MVAMPFKLGMFRRKAKGAKPVRKRSRLGVRGSLFLAFAAIAAMALVISGGASVLLDQLGRSPNFYFVHGYRLRCRDRACVRGVTEYGGEVPAVVESRNVAGVQFHPEKSQETGLALLRNFLQWQPSTC